MERRPGGKKNRHGLDPGEPVNEDPDDDPFDIFLWWKIALVDIGITDKLFWRLTIREFDGLVERRLMVRQREIDTPPAQIQATLTNLHLKKGAKPVTIEDCRIQEPALEPEESFDEWKDRMKGKLVLAARQIGGTNLVTLEER